jgi:hypothetical protein
MSFMGDLSLSTFTQRINSSLIQSLRSIHLVWPSRLKYHIHSRFKGQFTTFRQLWPGPHSDLAVAKAEWEELWQSFSQIGLVRSLRITIYDVHSVVRPLSVFPLNEMLPALHNVRAEEFVVEAWGVEERIEERSADRPFQLHYRPDLAYQTLP